MRASSRQETLYTKGLPAKLNSKKVDSPLGNSKSEGYIVGKEWMKYPSLSENLIDKKQLAEKLSLSLSYIDKLMAQNGLPHFKIGRAVRYRFSEVVTFLERRKRA